MEIWDDTQNAINAIKVMQMALSKIPHTLDKDISVLIFEGEKVIGKLKELNKYYR